jgi:hypothetical protein
MSELIPVLLGTKGLAEGEIFPLGLEGELVVGRSRSCSVSFQRFRRFLNLPPSEQALRDSYNSAVSRRHLVLRSRGTVITLENLSKGGSWCDDKPFSGLLEIDLSKKAVLLRLGQASETFQLTLLDKSTVDSLISHLGSPRPVPVPLPGVPDPVEDPTPQQNLVPHTGALTPRPIHHPPPKAPTDRPHTPPPDLEQSRYL